MANLYVDDIVVSESDGFVDVVLRLDAAATQAISVNFATQSATATSASSLDFLDLSGTVNFAVGQITQTVRITLTGNTTAVAEDLESFYFTLSSAVNASLGNTSALVSIVDNDTIVDTPTLSVRDVVVDERAGTATFVVMLGGPHGQASGASVSVDYATANGTALAGSDYSGDSGTLTFAAGETAKTITIAITNDAAAEGREHFGLDLSNATGATIVDDHAEGIIGASDATATALPRLAVADAVVGESDGYVDFVVTLSAPGQNAVSVAYSTTSATATSASVLDFLGRSGTLVFAPGETTKTVRVEISDDATAEDLETFYLNLTSPTNATIAKAWGTVNIVDDDTVVDTPTLFVRDAVVDEKAGTATFAVMLGGPTGQASNGAVSFNYATANGTATAGSDFTGTSGSLTFAPGETVKTITVDITDDATVEGFERFGLNLSNVVGATLLDGNAGGLIGASDATATASPRISVSDAVVSESDGYVDFVLTLSAPSNSVISLTASTSSATATSASVLDFLGTTQIVTFAPGETTKTVRVELSDDATAEDLETFYLNLTSPTNATIAKAWGTVNIVDDDTVVDTPTLFVRDAVVDEKAGTATFAVMLGGPTGQASNGAVSFNYATANGTATAGSDFTGTSGSLTFAPGETVKTITVDITDDATVEGFERFGLNLSNVVGATLLDGNAGGLIGASDATATASPRISVSDAVVSESDGYVDFVLTLSAPSNSVISLTASTSSATATSASVLDFLGTTQIVTFAPGETTKTVRVEISDDATAEDLETFYLNLTSPTNATIAKAWGTVNIVDDDTVVDTPTLFVRDAVVDEKAGTATFAVMLGGPTGQASNGAVSFNYATANGTATAGSDFTGTSGSLTFAPGETVKTITVDITDDATVEGFERFGLNLSNVVGATLLDGNAGGLIGASDATATASPRISVSDAVVSESDGYVDFVLTLSAPSNSVISLTASTSSATATSASVLDFLGTTQIVTFAPGETTKTVRVELSDDATAEDLETFYLNLTSPTNATIAKAWGTVNIVDDDTVVDTPTLFVRDAVVDEKAGTATFAVMLGGPTGQASNGAVSFNYATANGTATAGSDFTGTSGSLTFAPGETVKTITVDITDDATVEALERINLTLSGAVGATIVDGRAVAEVGASDAVAVALPHLTIADARVSEGDGYVDVVVSLTAPGTGVVTVNVTTVSGTATSASVLDFLGTTQLVTFAPGETTKAVRVQLTDNAAVEALESFTVSLSGATPAGVILDKASATITIVDNDTVGIDVFSFGRSDDIYTVNQTSDIVIENLNGGLDMVNSSATYTLPEHTENLTLTGAAAINGTGNALNNVIRGNSAANLLQGLVGNDTIDGGSGNDTMNGGTGDDLFVVGQVGDSVVEGVGAGTDKVNSTITYTLTVNVENLELLGTAGIFGTGNASNNSILGNSGANRLTGLAGNDTLNGAAGNDTMIGGLGNDVYVIADAGDVVTELVGQGTDTVQTNRTTTLSIEVENLTLTGSAAINGTGNASNNLITGNSAVNILSGLGGNDTLNGGAGADRLTGSVGNDTYVVDNLGDIVTELASGGTDTLVINRTATLSVTFANIEHLTLSGTAAMNGTGNAAANLITGNSAANVLSGLAGNDTLNGGLGNDAMIGGAGNDTYVVDAAGDITTETGALLTEIDTVQSSVTRTLGANLERLTLTGTAAISGTGNTLANLITGNSAANTLNGSSGNDTLSGAGGADTIITGVGSDTVILNSKVGIDRLTDYATASDTIRVSQATLRIGDGDTVVDGGVLKAGSGGFAAAAEVVVITTNIVGALTTTSAATMIGSATSAYTTGATRLFVVDNGADSGVYLFTSSGANAQVTAAELTQLALIDAANTVLGDYLFTT